MQRGGKFTLAAALFGWPAAEGNTAPDQLAPDSWLVQFRDQHATPDPAVLSGIFCSCAAGRDWVSEAARKVGLTLNTTAEHPADTWPSRIDTLQQTLNKRAASPTQLSVICNDAPPSCAACALVPTLLSCGDIAFTELSVKHQNRSPSAQLVAIASLLQPVAPALALAPHLTTLSLDPCTIPLPPPPHLPKLQQLSIRLAGSYVWEPNRLDSIFRSIAPYLAQLHTLKIDMARGTEEFRPIPWPALAPSTPTHTLTTLEHNSWLRDGLITFTVDHCPALRTLRGACGMMFDGGFGDREWGVEEVVLRQVDQCRNGLSSLLRRKAGPMTIRANKVTVYVYRAEGMDPTFCERLSDFTLHTDTLCVRPVIDMPWQYQTPALLNTITQLCGGLCAGGGAALVLRGWYWRPDTLLAYVRAIPTLTELGVERHRPRINGPLTDDLLTVAVANAHVLPVLEVDDLWLPSTQHANTPWPWKRLTIAEFQLSLLVKLPWPGGEGAPRKVVWDKIRIDKHVEQVGLDSIMPRLQHIDWLPQSRQQNNKITLQCGNAADTPDACAESLRTQLSVLRAIRVNHDVSCLRPTVVLHNWPLTHATLSALRDGLPEWASTDLSFKTCTFPLAPSEYTQLARIVPLTFYAWTLPDRCPAPLMEAVCARAQGWAGHGCACAEELRTQGLHRREAKPACVGV